jgi:hypothetical protein
VRQPPTNPFGKVQRRPNQSDRNPSPTIQDDRALGDDAVGVASVALATDGDVPLVDVFAIVGVRPEPKRLFAKKTPLEFAGRWALGHGASIGQASGQRHPSNVATYVHCVKWAGARSALARPSTESAQREAAHEQVFMLPDTSRVLALAPRTVAGKHLARGLGFRRGAR